VLLTVKLFATFRQGRFDISQMELLDGTTVGGVVDALRISRDAIGILMLGGRHADLDHRPALGEIVSILLLVGGG
jgi:sulfur-carrier protein